ncbi:MAG TPA: Gfo/Idh/MocA family oxidoreductase [Armatimonadota bacterium]|nr:Gfo/Idh/MocA family oxidoreductase [Armatimonadota bacterium]
MSERIDWGIIGTGMIAKTLADAINASETAELVGVGSRAQATADAFAADKGSAKAYGSYEALLADPDVRIVYNSLPNSMHCEWTIKTAEAGKHILCEKPLSVTVEEAERMYASADACGVCLMEAFMYRCHPQTTRLKEIIDSGRIGDLRIIHSTFSFTIADPANIRLSEPLAGGALMDVGCYCINFSRTMVGAEPVAAFGAAKFGAQSKVDENMAGTLIFEDGVFGQFDVGVKSTGRSGAEIVGSTGRIDVPSPWKPGDTSTIIVHDSSGTEEIEIVGASPYVLQVDAFGRTVTASEAPVLSREDSIGNMAAICAVLKSTKTGEVVKL